jgi:hypothetical protein
MPGVVCVHTNASSPEVFRAALRRGADSVLPKPMSRAHLLKLLRLAFDHATEAGREVEGDTLPEIALVDDSRAFLLGWRATLKGKARLHFFTSPQAFWAAADRDATLLARLAVLVTDYRFSSSSHDGATFALALRARRADLRILLASSGAFTEREVAGTFDAVLDKHALDWAAIAPHVRAGRPSGPALPAADEARQTNELA